MVMPSDGIGPQYVGRIEPRHKFPDLTHPSQLEGDEFLHLMSAGKTRAAQLMKAAQGSTSLPHFNRRQGIRQEVWEDANDTLGNTLLSKVQSINLFQHDLQGEVIEAQKKLQKVNKALQRMKEKNAMAEKRKSLVRTRANKILFENASKQMQNSGNKKLLPTIDLSSPKKDTTFMTAIKMNDQQPSTPVGLSRLSGCLTPSNQMMKIQQHSDQGSEKSRKTKLSQGKKLMMSNYREHEDTSNDSITE